ncbi:MAG: amidohydrolase family protein [Victivallaceae bacterium]
MVKNFNQSPLSRAFWEKGSVEDCPIYDMHGHMGSHNGIYFPLAAPEAMVRHLERVNAKLVFSHHHALFDPDFGNEQVFRIVSRYPDRLRMYVALNPNYPEAIRRDVAAYASWRPYAVGFKLLADYHRMAVDHPNYAPALEYADQHRLPVLFHTWSGSQFDGPEPMRRVIERYPGIKVICAHCFNPDWAGAVKLAKEFPGRVYLELTSIPGMAGVIEYLVREAGSTCLLFGTDLPWFDEYQALGGVLGTRLAEEDIRNILYRNAQTIIADF